MADRACPGNFTGKTGFLLQGFQDLQELKPFLFIVFLIIYIAIIGGNILIVAMVSIKEGLHSPMYFFLGNLSFLEIWYTTTTVPKMLDGLLKDGSPVSISGCLAQYYIFGCLAATECFLLAIMSYDRYIAICYPLHYSILMHNKICWLLAIGTWVTGFLPTSITVYMLSQLQYFGCKQIDHFFCDFEPLVNAACSDTSLVLRTTFILSFIATSIPFLSIIISYAYIISAILRIPSTTGRHKVFSTCSSHLAVVVMYFWTLVIVYVVPTSGHTMSLKKSLSLLYTIATPMFNPVIYTLRNNEIRVALKFFFKHAF